MDETRGLPGGSEGKESTGDAGDPGSIPGSGRCPGEGNGHPPQDSCLERPKDSGGRWAAVRGVTNIGTRASSDHGHLQDPES